MSSKRGKDEYPELEGIMFISPAERAKAEQRVRQQREAEAAKKAEQEKIEAVSLACLHHFYHECWE